MLKKNFLKSAEEKIKILKVTKNRSNMENKIGAIWYECLNELSKYEFEFIN